MVCRRLAGQVSIPPVRPPSQWPEAQSAFMRGMIESAPATEVHAHWWTNERTWIPVLGRLDGDVVDSEHGKGEQVARVAGEHDDIVPNGGAIGHRDDKG